MTLSLNRSEVITEVQRARLDTLYRIGNNCAHPKEAVNAGDVQALKSSRIAMPLQPVAVKGFLSSRTAWSMLT
jgi:hypothetical protein